MQAFGRMLHTLRKHVNGFLDRAAERVDHARLTGLLGLLTPAALIAWMVVALPACAWMAVIFQWTWPLWWLICAVLVTVTRRAASLMADRHRLGRSLHDAACRQLARRMRRPDLTLMLIADLPFMALMAIGLGSQ
ncbi:hypothetical protein [Bifidobacterium leontopitheci]|uniref:Uncharacterized protein n=1 Tax=Bifidobacterium leontopitheci TaxID=2650774 RepID=A0A6I1GHF2_9BIFI|nr:hypothetical protein [Bifidobacterium leontopitheci]KAB7791080.1 hypothetical protein F7D09_0436 [Bifidobacterium leontopitheci]